MAYRSLMRQTLHYFARPHQAVRRKPIEGSAAWTVSSLAPSTWRERWTKEELSALERLVAQMRPHGARAASLTRADVRLPQLDARIERWRTILRKGRGFVVIEGLPVDRWEQRDVEVVFWALGLRLGVPGAQNPQGDVLGHVRDQGLQPGAKVRQYRTREAIDFHCDAADVVGLLCLQPAARGGRSVLASSATVYNRLLASRPDLIDTLYAPFQLDTRSEGGLDILPVIPCRHHADTLRTFFHGAYFRSAPKRRGARPLSVKQAEVLEEYARILAEPGIALSMELQPGDIQWVCNHGIVHGRDAFEDDQDARRHLLRLWLSFEDGLGIRARLLAERDRVGLLRRAAMHWALRATGYRELG